MYFFDCFCEIGPRNETDRAVPWRIENVLKDMDRCGIAGALVTHTLSISNDPVDARRRLREDIGDLSDRLFPVWCVLPSHAGDFEATPEEFLADMGADNVRAVRLCPATHGYPFSKAVIGPMLDALEQRKVLTLIACSELPGGETEHFERLDALLADHAGLPVLLQGISWGSQRTILALMERHQNLHIEFSMFQVNRGLEQYVARFGADRLLFGTDMPLRSPGAARAYVDYAQISDADKAKIAGGNLTRLLGGLTPAPAPAQPADAIRDVAAEGRPLADVVVLDAHCHVLHEGGHGAGRVVMHKGDAEGILELKDVLGIDKTSLMTWCGPVASDWIDGNSVTLRAVRRHADRFVGSVYINPLAASEEELMSEVKRLVEEEGFRAFKPYMRVGLRYDDPLYAPVWEYMNAHKLHALLHLRNNVTGGPETVEALSEKYPDAHWLVAHTGSTWGLARSMAEVMKRRPNVWAELTYTSVMNGLIEWLAAEAGDDRILFGTDSPMRDPRPQFGWVVWADLPEASRRKILGENFARLLSLAEV